MFLATALRSSVPVESSLKNIWIKGKEGALGKSQTKDAEKSVKDATNVLQGQNLMLKLDDENFIAIEVCYHHFCRKHYLKIASSQENETKEKQQIKQKKKL